MATLFQVRLADVDPAYAAQAARALFDEADRLETLLSRFRENSEISALARLAPGETLRLSEPVFVCLTLAQQMEQATAGAFSVTAAARQTQSVPPRWTLQPDTFTLRCEAGRLAFDLGAIGKGFALDRLARELAEWECPSFLLIVGGSSILAGAPPPDRPGWSIGLGDADSEPRLLLQHTSLSGSGIAVQGRHILDPRTRQPARRRDRAWAQAHAAATSDALSTAFMVLTEPEIIHLLQGHPEWRAYLNEAGHWQQLTGANL